MLAPHTEAQTRALQDERRARRVLGVVNTALLVNCLSDENCTKPRAGEAQHHRYRLRIV